MTHRRALSAMKTTAARASAVVGLLFAAYPSSWDRRNYGAGVYAFSLTPTLFSSLLCSRRACQVCNAKCKYCCRHKSLVHERSHVDVE